MFRAYAYFEVNNLAIRMTSEAFAAASTADEVLAGMVERGATGGDIEQEVHGIGWVLATEVESAVIIRNRHLSDCGDLDLPLWGVMAD